MMEKCTNCGERVKRGMVNKTMTLEGVTVSADIPSWTCPKCSEVYYAGATAANFELVAAAMFGSLGIATGPVFRYMRKALGMRAADLAGMLGTTPETISRWENNKHEVDRPTMVLLTSLAMAKLGQPFDVAELLKQYQHPNRPIEPIHVKLAS